jgi:adenosine kinase
MSAPAAKKQKTEGPSLQGAILGMGNPLLDISQDVEQDVLDKYSVKMGNAILAEESHQPIYQELLDSGKAKFIAGGATQNSIRVAQWMLQTPGATSYFGAVGEDKYATLLTDCCKADNVATYYYVDKSTPTGTCAVLIKDQERSLIANLAAANNFKEEHLDQKEVSAVYEKARITYVAGFFLTVSPSSILRLAKNSNTDERKIFSMNLSAPFVVEFFKGPMMEAMPYCDLIFGNESEAETFAKVHGLAENTAEAVATHLAALPKTSGRSRMAVITQGAGDTVICVDGVVTKYSTPAVTNIVDANGAGDAFVGGFLAGLAKGVDTAECVKMAQYSASVILQVSGTELSGSPSY